MLATNQNWGDIKKYYLGTFVKFRELGDIPVFIENVNKSSINGRTIDHEVIELELCEEGYNLDYCIPKKTVFQVESNAYIFERIPARMWRKGWSSENSQLSRIAADGSFERLNWGFDFVCNFVNKTKYHKIQDLPNTKYLSIALSPRFYACASGIIGVDEQTVGVYVMSKNTIVYNKLFEREMKNLFRDQSIKLVTG
jgi:hypothetical protein